MQRRFGRYCRAVASNNELHRAQEDPPVRRETTRPARWHVTHSKFDGPPTDTLTSLKQPRSLDQPLEPLTFTVDKGIVDRIQAARVARSRARDASSHPDAPALGPATEELCSLVLAELGALHAAPHRHQSRSGETR